jgi:hypothetical protein
MNWLINGLELYHAQWCIWLNEDLFAEASVEYRGGDRADHTYMKTQQLDYYR